MWSANLDVSNIARLHVKIGFLVIWAGNPVPCNAVCLLNLQSHVLHHILCSTNYCVADIVGCFMCSGYGYGAGIRVDSPLGPIRLEYAWNDLRKGRFHIALGYE